MFVVNVGREMAQRRSLNETRESVEYIANLPRTIAYKIDAIEIDQPQQRGLLWYYRGTIKYVPKDHQKPERVEKDRDIIVERIHRACQHKRWTRTPWRIEGEPPPWNVFENPPDSSPQDAVERTRGANAEIVAAKGFVEFADPFAQNTHEEAGDEVHVAEVPPGVLPRESTSGDSPLRRQEYADGNGRTDPCDHSGLDLNEDLSSDKASGSPRSGIQGPNFSPRLPDDELVKMAAEKFGKASDPSRLKIMLVLAQQDRNVTELCGDLGSQSQPAVSHHLAILRVSHLVDARREGKHVYYTLTDEGRALAEVVEHVMD